MKCKRCRKNPALVKSKVYAGLCYACGPYKATVEAGKRWRERKRTEAKLEPKKPFPKNLFYQ